MFQNLRKSAVAFGVTGFGLAISVGGIVFSWSQSHHLMINSGPEVIGDGIALLGGLLQYRAGQPYVLNFTQNDWQLLTHTDAQPSVEYQLRVLEATHMKGKSFTYTMSDSAGGDFQEVHLDHTTGQDGTASFTAGAPFSGRLVIQ